MIYQYAPLAQAVEHLTFNQGVRGSIPRWSTKKARIRVLFLFLCDTEIDVYRFDFFSVGATPFCYIKHADKSKLAHL